MSNANQIKRLRKELSEFQQSGIEGAKTVSENISAGLKNENDFSQWKATIMGPVKTVYEGGLFNLDITIPTDYPFVPPKIVFKTPIFHPNIANDGSICLDILKDNWTPSLNLYRTLLSICSLLSDPNPKDPLRPEVAMLYTSDRSTFDAKAREYTIKHANK